MSKSFLDRWSRLKQAQEELAEPAKITEALPEELESEVSVALDVPQLSVDEELVDPELTDQAVLTDIDMPDLATINSTSDMSMFFSSGVSVELRRQALRKFFHQPEFNVRDPLDDYALDYSNPDKLVLKAGDTVRGWAKQQMDDAMQQARDALLQSESPAAADLQQFTATEQSEVVVDAVSDTTSDTTKVAAADRLGINDSTETK